MADETLTGHTGTDDTGVADEETPSGASTKRSGKMRAKTGSRKRRVEEYVPYGRGGVYVSRGRGSRVKPDTT